MKKIIIASFIILTILSGCSETDLFEKNPVAPGGETPDIQQVTVNEDGLKEIDLTQTFRNDILDYKWVGTAGELNIAKYLVFSESGNVKMYTKPFEHQDWELIQDFNISNVKVFTDDIDLMELSLEDVEAYDNNEGEIATIIEWNDILDLEITQGTEEGLCFVLYPEGAPVGVSSPFTLDTCLSGANSRMTINMLNTTFNLEKQ